MMRRAEVTLYEGKAYTDAIKKSQEKTVMVVSAASLNFGGGGFDFSVSMDGTITADVSQDIYISSTQTVDEVFVTEGQKVYVGDKLLSYDTVKTSMNLEKEKINREQIELQIDVARRNLVTLNKLKPVSSEIAPTEEPSESDDSGEGEEEEPYGDEEFPDEEIPALAKASFGNSMNANPVQLTQEEWEDYFRKYLM